MVVPHKTVNYKMWKYGAKQNELKEDYSKLESKKWKTNLDHELFKEIVEKLNSLTANFKSVLNDFLMVQHFLFLTVQNLSFFILTQWTGLKLLRKHRLALKPAESFSTASRWVIPYDSRVTSSSFDKFRRGGIWIDWLISPPRIYSK